MARARTPILMDQAAGKRRSVTAFCHIATLKARYFGHGGDDAMHIADYITVLKRMKFLATATAVSLATLIAVTATLWWVKFALPGAVNHPVFFYLLPTAVLAMVYGVGEGALFALAAFACSAFLLYEPIYSFQVSNHELGELFWFLMTALIGVKCVAELRHHSEKS